LFRPLAFFALPLADLTDDAVVRVDLTGLLALRAGAALAGFCLRAGADFFFATGVLRAGFLEAGFLGAAFFAGFLKDGFLVERAIKLMVGASFSSRPDLRGGLTKSNSILAQAVSKVLFPLRRSPTVAQELALE
jgi:hypothetical protein